MSLLRYGLVAVGLALAGSPAIAETVRFATFNAALSRDAPGALIRDLGTGDDPQARAVAAIIQRVRPDVLLLNEVDHDPEGAALQHFQARYLAVSQGGAPPIDFPHTFTAESNTGVASGFDLDGDGAVGGPGDAFGYGAFPGQYGMAVLSRWSIERAAVRTFQTFLWQEMPEALLPADFYGEAAAVVRLSSKSHWDVPIVIGATTVHLLASHPTPPVFDGPEDRNGRRNHDEIRFWADYVRPGAGGYIEDDAGARGGLAKGKAFVIAGDLNADPVDGDSLDQAVRQLLDHGHIDPQVTPSSTGGIEDAARDGGRNRDHGGDPAHDTADFGDFRRAPGNLRTDYLLPSRGLEVSAAGIFWPTADDPAFALVGDDRIVSSDHRLVWIDLEISAP